MGNPRHEAWEGFTDGLARAVRRGELPPRGDRTFLQQAAVEAVADGACPDFEYVRAKRTRLGHGHVEGLACLVKVKGGAAMWDRQFPQARTHRGEGDREESASRAARRAKQKVRQLAKALGCSSMGTLTYQANMIERSQFWRDFKLFIRKVRERLPHFEYVVVPEKQKRGAYHAHFGMSALPARIHCGRGVFVKSWNWMRSLWRQTIKGGGNFDEQKKLGRGAHARVMKIAHYIGKYVAKDFAEGELDAKRYAASRGGAAVVESRRFDASNLAEAIAWVYGAIDGEMIECQSWHSRERSLYWISAYTGAPRS